MSVKSIIDAALNKARSTAGSTKTASAGQPDGLIKEANQVADALEYMALEIVDDGTPSGAAQRRVVEDFFKGADTQAIKGPAQSVSPTGTQAVPPQTGARKILPTGQASGTHPAESEAPTGTQATIGQSPGGEKKADKPVTLLDMLTKHAMDMGSGTQPKNSEALQDTADPGKQNENRNVDRALGSNEAPVNLTKRDAKAPTRDRLKALFASASDTGPSSAAAKAAFPTAYSRGGMKVADAKCEKCGKEPCECKGAEKKAEGEVAAPAPAPEAQPGWMESQRMIYRAQRAGDHGLGLVLAHPDLARSRFGTGARHGLVGAGVGALGGAGLGAAVGGSGGAVLGGLAGAGLGGLTGFEHGAVSANQRWLADRGMEQRWHGGVRVTDPAAAAQYRDAAQQAAAEQAAAEQAAAAQAAAAQGKTASAILSDYATLFDKAAAGELGPEARAFAEYIEQVQI